MTKECILSNLRERGVSAQLSKLSFNRSAPFNAVSGRGLRSRQPQPYDRATWVRQLSRVDWIRASPKRHSPPATTIVSAFVDPAQGIGGVYGVRYELVTAGASADPGRT